MDSCSKDFCEELSKVRQEKFDALGDLLGTINMTGINSGKLFPSQED